MKILLMSYKEAAQAVILRHSEMKKCDKRMADDTPAVCFAVQCIIL